MGRQIEIYGSHKEHVNLNPFGLMATAGILVFPLLIAVVS
jgi:hypothetical protein